jgi:linoleoyl-CoA desaturase
VRWIDGKQGDDAITDVRAFAHLTDADIESLAVELDAIRLDIEDSLGERDARCVRRTIAAQRTLEVAGWVILAASSKRSAWWAGAITLAVAKIVENMEIGHNVIVFGASDAGRMCRFNAGGIVAFCLRRL